MLYYINYIDYIYMGIFPAFISVYDNCVWSQEGISIPELWLQRVVSCYVDARSQSQVLCKGRKCS